MPGQWLSRVDVYGSNIEPLGTLSAGSCADAIEQSRAAILRLHRAGMLDCQVRE